MAITAAQLRWNFTVQGSGRKASSGGKSLGGWLATNAPASGVMQNVYGNLIGTQNKAGVTDYRCLAVVNTSLLTLSSVKVYFYKTQSGGATFSMGLDPTGVVTNVDTLPVAVEAAGGTSAPAGVSFSIPTVSSPLAIIGTLAPNAAVAVWFRRAVSNVAGINPETNIAAIAGTSPI